jgi:putative transposase
MRFRFIGVEKANYPIVVLCSVLQVSRAGFYAWQRRPVSLRSRTDRTLAGEIRRIQGARRETETYGSPRITRELRANGRRVGRHRVARLMRQEGLAARQRQRFKVTTNSAHRFSVAPNLLARDFRAERPNQLWVADVTYIRTLQGWLYLAVVVDLFSRAVVGWAMDDHIGGELSSRALRMALQRRRPARGLIHHSDRGIEYACDEFQTLLDDHGLVCSMSRKGDCWDNAVAESFFASLKLDLDPERVYVTRAEAKRDLFGYIEGFYNRNRRHSSLGYLSPEAFEAGNVAA